jgi:hypothetical protein
MPLVLRRQRRQQTFLVSPRDSQPSTSAPGDFTQPVDPNRKVSIAAHITEQNMKVIEFNQGLWERKVARCVFQLEAALMAR